MDLHMKEQGRYGSPDSESYHKCEVCGQAINRRLKRCLACRTKKISSQKEQTPPSGKLGTWLVLLLIALITWGAYRVIMRMRADETPVATDFTPAKLGAGERPSPESLTTPASLPHATSVTPPTADPGTANAPVSAGAAKTAAPLATSSDAAPTTQADGPNLAVETITCPACAGRGRLAYDPPRTGVYTCPVCAGRGSRVRRYLTANWKLCATCKGMGTLPKQGDLFRTKNVVVKETCPTCAGRGLVPQR